MKAYKWAFEGFPILLECEKEEAFHIIKHFGYSAKASTLPIEEKRKVSFYGLNIEACVIAPIKTLSLIVSGHEIPEIGPETTVALFLDNFRLVNLEEWWEHSRVDK